MSATGSMGQTTDEIAAGSSSIMLGSPTTSEDLSISVPRVQVTAAYRRKLDEAYELSALYSHGPGEFATRVGVAADSGDRDVVGVGMAMQRVDSLSGDPDPSADGAGRFRLASMAYALVYAVPVYFSGQDATALVPALGFGFHPSWTTGRLTIYARVGLGTQPITHETVTVRGESPRVPFLDALAFLIAAGVEIDFGTARVAVQVMEPFMMPATRFLPALGFLVSVPLRRAEAPRPRPPAGEVMGVDDPAITTCQAACPAGTACQNLCDFGATYAAYGDAVSTVESSSCDVVVPAEAAVEGTTHERTMFACCCVAEREAR